VLSEIPARRRIVVLGEIDEPPGSQGPIYRKTGERIAKVASRFIFVGSRRTFRSYATGAKRGGLPRERIINVGREVLKAVEALREDLVPGDVVLIKGGCNQRFDRVSLSLTGRTVLCKIRYCDAKEYCASCPMLERGWRGLKVVI
jgi:UDP-N-acetylmuramyl pentapeptide synthase